MQAQKELRQRAEEANVELEGQRQSLEGKLKSLTKEAEVSRLFLVAMCVIASRHVTLHCVRRIL